MQRNLTAHRNFWALLLLNEDGKSLGITLNFHLPRTLYIYYKRGTSAGEEMGPRIYSSPRQPLFSTMCLSEIQGHSVELCMLVEGERVKEEEGERNVILATKHPRTSVGNESRD